MNSCLYVGQVKHRRFAPRPHAFSYRLFMVYLDLGELQRAVRAALVLVRPRSQSGVVSPRRPLRGPGPAAGPGNPRSGEPAVQDADRSGRFGCLHTFGTSDSASTR